MPHRLPSIRLPDVDIDEHTLVDALANPSAFPKDACAKLETKETHISRVVLSENFAYKIKKPLRNEFLDYSTLERRKQACLEELRLDRRYAPELYVGVVPIVQRGKTFLVEGEGEIVEYAVKMRRFEDGALLSERLDGDEVTLADVQSLAVQLGHFHQNAEPASTAADFGDPQGVREDALDNFRALESMTESKNSTIELTLLREWTNREYQQIEPLLGERKRHGHIRECHGDLHAGNIVFWHKQWTPFDGIEFNERFRWIDTMSDAGFLAMDLVARQHAELFNLFISQYLETTGDYSGLRLLRWYMVFRAMVRAKVAGLRLGQLSAENEQQPTNEIENAKSELDRMLSTAVRIAENGRRGLWITHGLSGSGKSTGSLQWVRQAGAIRLRSDVERKRMFRQQPTDRPTGETLVRMYSAVATSKLYRRLSKLADLILKAGYAVVVDATFLKRAHRNIFARLAQENDVSFQILDFQTPDSSLKSRIAARTLSNGDASDADLQVLEKQQQSREPLTNDEQSLAIIIRPSIRDGA
ncbi:MAG: AAA family ATPase [Planctomycetales bacterium]|nr:AAA family ATPase [Planctomycetales bacterium]